MIRRAFCLLVVTLTACSPFVGEPTPTCQIVPMPTGEHSFPAEFTVEPPARVTAGEEVGVAFSGGYILVPTGYQCGETFILATPNLATAQVTQRRVQVFLDDQQIHEADCPYDCELTFTIPADTAPAAYTLDIRSVLTTHEFPIDVIQAEFN
jgi:hypothetical protein